MGNKARLNKGVLRRLLLFLLAVSILAAAILLFALWREQSGPSGAEPPGLEILYHIAWIFVFLLIIYSTGFVLHGSGKKPRGNRLHIILGLVLAILVISILALSAFPGPEIPSDFSLDYYYTSELSYIRIGINQSRLLYTYFDDPEGRCDDWVFQHPCWTEDELKTAEAALSGSEILGLAGLINQTGFMQLGDSYGEDALNRHYPAELSVRLEGRENRVIYRDSPDAPPPPQAFGELEDRLFELLNEKFYAGE
jgi:hypothetical protein